MGRQQTIENNDPGLMSTPIGSTTHHAFFGQRILPVLALAADSRLCLRTGLLIESYRG
jgi:hypothetical protein